MRATAGQDTFRVFCPICDRPVDVTLSWPLEKDIVRYVSITGCYHVDEIWVRDTLKASALRDFQACYLDLTPK